MNGLQSSSADSSDIVNDLKCSVTAANTGCEKVNGSDVAAEQANDNDSGSAVVHELNISGVSSLNITDSEEPHGSEITSEQTAENSKELRPRKPMQLRNMQRDERKRKREEELSMLKRKKEEERLEKKRLLDAEKAAQKQKKDQEKEEKQRQLAEETEKKRLKQLERLEEKRKKDDEKNELKKQKEEKRLQEEQLRRKKEEEKKQQELERLKQQQEEEEKAMRAKERFLSFFVKHNKPTESVKQLKYEGRFKPFELKEGMSLAPDRRVPKPSSDETSAFSNTISKQDFEVNGLYISELKTGLHKARQSFRTLERPSAEVVVLNSNDDSKPTSKAKLFQFRENYRPPYYGTFRKTSALCTGRRPFARDTKFLNYDVDSDDEWEGEPEDGEECKTDEEEDGEEDLDDESDDGFLVPHDYLSPDEGVDAEEELDPEIRLERAKLKDKIWREEKFSKKFNKLVPICVGLIYSESAIASLPADGNVLKAFESAKAIVEEIPDFTILVEADVEHTPKMLKGIAACSAHSEKTKSKNKTRDRNGNIKCTAKSALSALDTANNTSALSLNGKTKAGIRAFFTSTPAQEPPAKILKMDKQTPLDNGQNVTPMRTPLLCDASTDLIDKSIARVLANITVTEPRNITVVEVD